MIHGNGLILGFNLGGARLPTCGPLLAAFLATEQIILKRSAALLTVFLSGRLLGYGGGAEVELWKLNMAHVNRWGHRWGQA